MWRRCRSGLEVETLAAYLDALAADPAIRARMGRAAREYAVANTASTGSSTSMSPRSRRQPVATRFEALSPVTSLAPPSRAASTCAAGSSKAWLRACASSACRRYEIRTLAARRCQGVARRTRRRLPARGSRPSSYSPAVSGARTLKRQRLSSPGGIVSGRSCASPPALAWAPRARSTDTKCAPGAAAPRPGSRCLGSRAGTPIRGSVGLDLARDHRLDPDPACASRQRFADRPESQRTNAGFLEERVLILFGSSERVGTKSTPTPSASVKGTEFTP